MDILGTQVETKLSSSETNGAYYVFEITFPPGEMIPPHVHQLEDEIVCISNGELEVFVGGEIRIARPGDVCNFPRSVPHGMKNNSDQNTVATIFVSPGSSFEAFFGKLTQLSKGPDTDMPAVLELAGRHGMTFV